MGPLTVMLLLVMEIHIKCGGYICPLLYMTRVSAACCSGATPEDFRVLPRKIILVRHAGWSRLVS
jgi:hypothetical protein